MSLAAETQAPPFALPDLITTVVDLPFPPTANLIWRQSAGRKPHLSKDYQDWKKAADIMAVARYQLRGKRIIQGHFEAHIGLNADIGKRGDIDNRIKAVMDWAQSRLLIINDKNCRRLTVEWTAHANAPEGCRLILRELVSDRSSSEKTTGRTVSMRNCGVRS